MLVKVFTTQVGKESQQNVILCLKLLLWIVGCGGHIVAQSGTINGKARNAMCEWIIEVGDGKAVQIEFTYFEANDILIYTLLPLKIDYFSIREQAAMNMFPS